MKDKSKKSVSESLETNEILLPHIPYLIQDLWALGCSLELILEAVGKIGDRSSNQALLDLGCGKGAVAINIALKYGSRVIGIDAMPPFLEEARSKAREFNVARLCEFVEADLRDYTADKHEFDIVILASLGGVFGSIKETVGILRTQIKPGGYMIIDDGYLKALDSSVRKGYGHYRNYPDTLSELSAFGDELIDEYDTNEISLKINKEYLGLMRKRGAELAESHPSLAGEISSYIVYQEEECRFLEREIDGRLWLLRKV